jgi:phage gp37-like protein
MRELVLSFSGGRAEGSGLDIVGPFTFHGTYDSDGTMSLIKKYPHHTVTYLGQWDGEGTVHGEWSIGTYARGKFALAFDRSTKPERTEISEISAEEPGSNAVPNHAARALK